VLFFSQPVLAMVVKAMSTWSRPLMVSLCLCVFFLPTVCYVWSVEKILDSSWFQRCALFFSRESNGQMEQVV
jgi:hypothetical protein